MDTNLTSLTDTNLTDVVGPVTSVVNQLLEVSPPVGLALLLSVIYAFILSFTRINRLVLDISTIVVASALYPQLANPGKVGFAVHNPIMAEVVTGGLIGCAAIICNPAIRRALRFIGVLDEDHALLPSYPPILPPPPPSADKPPTTP